VRGIRLDVDKRSWARMPTTLASMNELRSAPMRIDQAQADLDRLNPKNRVRSIRPGPAY
jgi:hypothetical protein